MMAVEFAQEPFADVIEEAKPLLERHWRELARNQQAIPLDPDYPRYHRLAEQGVLRVFTVRETGTLVGYAAYIVAPHLHYRTVLWAISDILWVAPEKRRGMLGVLLVQYVEGQLRESGVDVMHTTGKEAHPALAVVLERLGHERIEFGHAKVLKGAV